MPMELVVERLYKKDNYTIGILKIDGLYECDTLEDTDRGLSQDMPESEITKKKKYGKTAIPTGRYKVTFGISNRFGKCFYAINSMIPSINNVKGFTAIRIHAGTDENDTEGCLLLGENKAKGKVLYSGKTCERVFRKMWLAYNYGSPIWITIK